MYPNLTPPVNSAYPSYPSTNPTYPQTNSYQPSNTNYNLRQIFDSWDTDGSGDLDEYELAEVLRQMGEHHDKETVRQMIKMYDYDGNGKIDFNEFADLFPYIQSLRSRFRHHAGNQNGRIGFDEAENILKSLHGPSMVAAPALLWSIWKVYDKSGTGKVHYRDFLLMAISLKTVLNGYNKQQQQQAYMGNDPYYQQQYYKPSKMDRMLGFVGQFLQRR